MDRSCHKVSGCFTQRAPAENTLSRLIQRGLHHEDLRVFMGAGNLLATSPPPGSSARTLNDLLSAGLIGAGIGIGLGVLLEVALLVSYLQLLNTSPLQMSLPPGWGAVIGGFLGSVIGAAKGIGEPGGRFAERLSDSVAQADRVLVAKTHNEQETAIARDGDQGDGRAVQGHRQGRQPARNPPRIVAQRSRRSLCVRAYAEASAVLICARAATELR